MLHLGVDVVLGGLVPKHLVKKELMDRAGLLAFQALLRKHFELDLLLVTDTRRLFDLLERFFCATVRLEVNWQ